MSFNKCSNCSANDNNCETCIKYKCTHDDLKLTILTMSNEEHLDIYYNAQLEDCMECIKLIWPHITIETRKDIHRYIVLVLRKKNLNNVMEYILYNIEFLNFALCFLIKYVTKFDFILNVNMSCK
jgi:hypothetical protein